MERCRSQTVGRATAQLRVRPLQEHKALVLRLEVERKGFDRLTQPSFELPCPPARLHQRIYMRIYPGRYMPVRIHSISFSYMFLLYVSMCLVHMRVCLCAGVHAKVARGNNFRDPGADQVPATRTNL